MSHWEANKDLIFYQKECGKYSTLTADEIALIARIFEPAKDEGGMVSKIMSNIYNRIKLNINNLTIIIIEPMTHMIFDIESIRFGNFKDIIVIDELDPS